jgi:hypothetical protein
MDKYKLAPNPLLGTDAYDKLFSFSGLGDLYFQIIHGFDGSDTLVGQCRSHKCPAAMC